MRNPNGYGSIRKLSGKRRRPYGVYVTTGFELTQPAPEIAPLEGILSADLYEQVQAEYVAYKAKQRPVAKQVQQCIGYYETRQEAMIALAEYNKSPFDVGKRSVTFGQIYDILFAEKFSKMKRSAKTAYVTAYKKCGEISGIRMVELRKAHMQKIIDDNSDKSKSTLNTLLVLFNAIYKFALENDICEKNYAQFVTAESKKEKKEKKPFSREEIEALWDNLDWISERSRPTLGAPCVDMALIHIYTGVRPQELLDIKKADVHLEERWIDLRENGTKTKAASRIVPIHRKIIPLIGRRMQGENEHLFTDGRGRAFTARCYRRSFFAPMCERFGMEHTPHECRHTFATFAAASKLNQVLLKKIIGHAAGDLTEDTYTHAFIEDLVAEIDKLNI